MKLLTQKTLKGIFYPKSVFTILLALVTVFACEVEEPVPTYTLTTSVTPSEGGKIILSPQEPNYVEGTQVTLTPEPNENWVFKQWEGDASGSTSPLQLTMNANKSVVGVFVKRDYPLNIKIEGEGTVEEKIISNPSGREYPHGTTVELTPKPKEGWEFGSWSEDLTGNESPKRITVDKQKNVTVKFKKIVSIEITNSLDTIVISKKIKFEIKGYFSDGSSIDLSNQVKLSSEGNILTMLEDNYFVGAKSGRASIIVSYMDLIVKDDFYVNYYEEVLNNSSPFLQENNNSPDILNVPIVIINFHPTDDGVNIDPKYYSNDYFIKDRFYSYYNIDRNVCNNNPNNSICNVGTLEMYKIRAQNLHSLTKFAIENGSRFRGYSNNSATKSVNIHVVKYYNFYELKRKIYTINSLPEPDYQFIFSKINLDNLVNTMGVKEVWFSLPKIFADHPNIINGTLPSEYLLSIAESNMSSPYGDISNSSRFEGDLPKYGKTYVVYGVDIDRGPAEALHNRGHQIESQLSFIEKNKQWPNQLFWNKFVGMRESGGPIGRAGSTHFPPNSNIDYDYRNLNLIESDIESWNPSGGQKAKINVERWREINYSFPENIFWDNKAEAGENPLFSNNVKDDPHYKWLLFWFQSIPGRNNNIAYTTNLGKETVLSNWWEIFYNWDDAIFNKKTLWKE
jgi:hypothetical protein